MDRRRALLVLLTGLSALQASGCGEEPPPLPRADPATRRVTAQGEVVGFTSAEGAHVWRGIPFAEPPLGDLRWRAPRPPQAWEGTREALSFGPPCVQFAGRFSGGAGRSGEPSGSEDCLHLNVFAPPFAPEQVPTGLARRPVMVWLHGGGNTVGSAHFYDASQLARERGVVVVTVHYRLGLFGWFSHPALREGSSGLDGSGNYGTLDLVRALHWLQENASAFGGDPDRVTVFGESAGGANVFSLLLAAPARGSFHRAIIQSGSPRTVTRAEAENLRDDAEPGHAFSSREVTLRLLQRAGRAVGRAEAKLELAKMSGPEIAEWLRALPASEVLSVFERLRFAGMYDSPRLVRDGRVLPRGDPLDSFARAGRTNEVPTILGTNRDENKLFMLFSSPHLRRIAWIPLGFRNERMYALNAEYASLMWKAAGVDDPAVAMRRVRDDVWAYRFDWDDERSLLWMDMGELLGAAHGLEIPFVFGTLRLGGAERLVFDPGRAEDDRRLADAITSYWTRFALTGNPGRGREGELPAWEPWDADGGSFLVLDSDRDGGIRMSDDTVSREAVTARVARDSRFESQAERCEVYADFVTWSRTLTRAEYEQLCDGAP